MEYIELAYNVRELYPDRKIMLVYSNDTVRREAVSLANESGRFRKIDTGGVSAYNIVGVTNGVIDIVSVSSDFNGGWSDVTDIWYDERISVERIGLLKRDVTRNASLRRDSVVTIPFSMVRSTYTLDEDIPIEEDVCLEEYLSELFSGSSSKEVCV